MYFATDYPLPLYTQPYLLECDIDLVMAALYSILHPNRENSDPPLKSVQITEALINYIKDCNDAFLASENIRAFLLLSLLVTLIISFIALAMLPVTPLNIALICILSLVLFSVNIFTLFHQMNGYQQESDWARLSARCSAYTTEKLCSKDKVSSPTSAPCLFPAKKIPLNDALHNNKNDHPLNRPEQRLSPIEETFVESNSEEGPLLSFTK